MKNFVQSGDVVTVAAPADVSSGQFVAVGALYGVAQADAKSGEDVALATKGVFELPVANGSAVSVGDRIYVAADGALDAEATDGGDPAVAYERAGVAVSDAVVEAGTARVKVKLG